MYRLIRNSRNLLGIGATLAIAALVVTLLAASFVGGSVQAQAPGGDGNTGSTGSTGSTDGGNTDPYPNLSTYPDPQPCGPGAGTASMEEPHEITSGHYALFDAYWRTIATSTGSTGPGASDHGVGVLHTNLCPPEMVATTTTVGSGRNKKTIATTTRENRVGGMDIEEAIIHVLNTHLATTTVATSTGAGELSLAEYPRVRNFVDPGDRVWWLRLDDPDTSNVDETSDLGIGFSTALLDPERWDSPMRYRIEVERHPTNPGDVPHFFAYEAPKPGNVAQPDPVWDSANPGNGVMELGPGEYRELQWVFTEPGTYLLWVHLLGDVKQPESGDDWKPISGNTTETSEVYRYTFQVGDTLDETEPPIFGVNRGVGENSPGGVEVGDPIPVYNAEADVLYYDLTGPGHSNFDLLVSTSSAPHSVQIVVADGANLDYETKPSYELHLTVTDKVDHEHNFDPYADDVIIVRIDLEDQAPGVVLRVDRTKLSGGEWLNFFARYEPTEAQLNLPTSYEWATKRDDVGPNGEDLYDYIPGVDGPTWSVAQANGTTETYQVSVAVGAGPPDLTFVATHVEVDLSNQP